MADEWTKEKIEQLISNQIQESLDLEYKGAGALENKDHNKSEISKDVSAMANSAGGTIIYGISESTDKDKKISQISIDPIDESKISKEWLDQIISSNISPRIDGIKIFPIIVNSENEVVYVVEIPQSDTAHQSKDKRYYKRINTTTDAMNDYEIRDIMARSKTPKFELSFVFQIEKYISKETTAFGIPLNTYNMNNVDKEISKYCLNIKAKNVGSVYAKYVNAFFYIPFYIVDYDIKERDIIAENGVKYYEDYEDNTVREMVDYKAGFPKYGPARYDPILPGLSRRWEIPIKNLDELLPRGYFTSSEKLKWTIHADNAPSISGEVYLDTIDIVIAKEPPNA